MYRNLAREQPGCKAESWQSALGWTKPCSGVPPTWRCNSAKAILPSVPARRPYGSKAVDLTPIVLNEKEQVAGFSFHARSTAGLRRRFGMPGLWGYFLERNSASFFP